MKFGYTMYREKINEKLECSIGKKFKIITESKNNGVAKEGVCFWVRGSKISPVIYFDTDKWIYDETDVESFVEEALKMYEEVYQGSKTEAATLRNWHVIKHLVRPRVINYKNNRKHLMEHNVPYVRFLDLAIIFVIPTETIFPNLGTGTIGVSSVLFDEYGIGLEELYTRAMENLKKESVTFKTVGQMVTELQDDGTEYPKSPLHVLTCYDGYYGAAAMLNRKALKNACEKLKCNRVYILPSSVHELLVLDEKEMEVSKLQFMVREINREVVDDEMVLSDNVYAYDCTKGYIELIGGTGGGDQ